MRNALPVCSHLSTDGVYDINFRINAGNNTSVVCFLYDVVLCIFDCYGVVIE